MQIAPPVIIKKLKHNFELRSNHVKIAPFSGKYSASWQQHNNNTNTDRVFAKILKLVTSNNAFNISVHSNMKPLLGMLCFDCKV